MTRTLTKEKHNLSNEKRKSLYTYLVLLMIALITMYWGQELAVHRDNTRVWNIANVLLMLIGIPFILLQKQAGLPEVWQSTVSNQQRIRVPLLIGLLFGLLDVVIIKCIIHPEPYESMPPFLQPFPYSVFLYTSGAFEVEVFFRLIPLTLVLLGIAKWWLKDQHTPLVFWIVAVLTSLREPIEQWPSGAMWFIIYAGISGFLFNLLQAIYLRKAGFLAALFIRLGHYLLWHVLLGIYVELVELAK